MSVKMTISYEIQYFKYFCKLVLAIFIALDPCYEIVTLLQFFPLNTNYEFLKDFSKFGRLMRLYKNEKIVVA